MTNEMISQPDLNKFYVIKQGAVDVLKSPYGVFYASITAGIFAYAIYNKYVFSFNTRTGVLSFNVGC